MEWNKKRKAKAFVVKTSVNLLGYPALMALDMIKWSVKQV